MRIVILAPNPAIDLEWEVDAVRWDEKNLIKNERRWAGGKGVNVARWLRFLGGTPRLVVPLGGASGTELRQQMRCESLACRIIRLREANRVDAIITTPEGRQLRFNPAGPAVSAAEWSAIRAAIDAELNRAGLLILSGSLPRGAAPDTYARFIDQAQQHSVRTVLDCDGAVFAEAVKAKPFLVKPNEHELALWCGRRLKTESAAQEAARKLSVATGGWVLVTRGGRTAWLINAQESVCFSAQPPPAQIRNSVGAGDAVVAGAALQIVRGAPAEEWLRWGLAAGTAATQCRAGELPRKHFVTKSLAEIQVNKK